MATLSGLDFTIRLDSKAWVKAKRKAKKVVAQVNEANKALEKLCETIEKYNELIPLGVSIERID